MTNANDPAFTGPTENGFTAGLTKREYFAAMALQAQIRNMGEFDSAEDVCKYAVGFADSLINTLNKTPFKK